MPASSVASPSNGILVLSGYGIRVTVERGHLSVEDGVGRNRRSARFSRPARELRRLVILGHSGTISLDALRWLSDIGAAFVQIDSDGKVISAAGPINLQDAKLRRAQARAGENGRGLAIAKQLVREKLTAQLAVLDRLPTQSEAKPVIQAAIDRTEEATTIGTLRVIEAEGALAYWKAWAPVEVPLARRDACRIPARWLTFGRRGSLITGNSRRATDPANAMLNYLYAITEAEARIAALAVGLDPGIGVMHADQKARDSLACDLMEPIRPLVDAWLLHLLEGHTFQKAAFFETREGVCRVMPPLTSVLAETAPQWAAALAPVAERTARQLLGEKIPKRSSKPKRKALPTPLTQANRRAGRDKYRRHPALPPIKPTRLQRNCEVCGVRLTGRAQRLCEVCLPIVHPNPLAEALRANAAWEKSAADIPDREHYLREIAPRVSGASISSLMQVTGLSRTSCELMRRRKVVPHPRHWEALRQLG